MNKKIFAVIFPVLTVFFASLFASKYPDTLETLAINYGFEKQAKEITLIFKSYSAPFISSKFLSVFCAGLIGLVALYILYLGISTAVKFLFPQNKWTKSNE